MIVHDSKTDRALPVEHKSQHVVPEDKVVDALITTTGLVSVAEQRDSKDDSVGNCEGQPVSKYIVDSLTQIGHNFFLSLFLSLSLYLLCCVKHFH